jgi:hypothetical protein
MSPARQRPLVAKERGDLAGEDAAVAVDEGDLGALHLALATLPAYLAHRLADEEQAVHTGMVVRGSAAAGVDRKLPGR